MLEVRFARVTGGGDILESRIEEFETESQAINFLWNHLPAGWSILWRKSV